MADRSRTLELMREALRDLNEPLQRSGIRIEEEEQVAASEIRFVAADGQRKTRIECNGSAWVSLDFSDGRGAIVFDDLFDGDIVLRSEEFARIAAAWLTGEDSNWGVRFETRNDILTAVVGVHEYRIDLTLVEKIRRKLAAWFRWFPGRRR